jgi:hypothetical protein
MSYERGGATAVGAAPLPVPGQTGHGHQPGRGCEIRHTRGGVTGDKGSANHVAHELPRPWQEAAYRRTSRGCRPRRTRERCSRRKRSEIRVARELRKLGHGRRPRDGRTSLATSRCTSHDMRPISCWHRVAPQGRLPDYHTRAWRPSRISSYR